MGSRRETCRGTALTKMGAEIRRFNLVVLAKLLWQVWIDTHGVDFDRQPHIVVWEAFCIFSYCDFVENPQLIAKILFFASLPTSTKPIQHGCLTQIPTGAGRPSLRSLRVTGPRAAGAGWAGT